MESISDLSLAMVMSLSSRAVFMSCKADSYLKVCSMLASLGGWLSRDLTSVSNLSLPMVMSLSSRVAISFLIISELALSLIAMACFEASLGGVVNLPLMHGVNVTAGDWPLDLKTEAGVKAAVIAGEITGGNSSVAQRVVVVTAAVPRAGLEKAGKLIHPGLLIEFVVTVVVTILEVEGEDGDDLGTTEEVETGLDTGEDVETGLGTNLKQPKGLIMFPSSSVAAILFGTVLCQLTLFLEHKTEFKFLDKSLTDFQGICWKYL